MATTDRRYTLPRAARISSQEVFREAYRQRHAAHDRRLSLRALPNNLPITRLGISVSRKFGSAVRRNRIRRLIREAFRHVRHDLPVGLDLVVLPRAGEEPTVAQLRDSFLTLTAQLARRLGHVHR